MTPSTVAALFLLRLHSECTRTRRGRRAVGAWQRYSFFDSIPRASRDVLLWADRASLPRCSTHAASQVVDPRSCVHLSGRCLHAPFTFRQSFGTDFWRRVTRHSPRDPTSLVAALLLLTLVREADEPGGRRGRSSWQRSSFFDSVPSAPRQGTEHDDERVAVLFLLILPVGLQVTVVAAVLLLRLCSEAAGPTSLIRDHRSGSDPPSSILFRGCPVVFSGFHLWQHSSFFDSNCEATQGLSGVDGRPVAALFLLRLHCEVRGSHGPRSVQPWQRSSFFDSVPSGSGSGRSPPGCLVAAILLL